MLMNMEDKAKKVGLMKDDVVSKCESLKVQSSLIYLFTLQWNDLEQYLDDVKKGIDDRYEEVKAMKGEVKERRRKVELEMSSKKRQLVEYEAEMIKMEEKIRSLEKVIEERSNESACAEEEKNLGSKGKIDAICSEGKEEEIEYSRRLERYSEKLAIPPVVVPHSSQSYSQSPQAGKRTKELARKRRSDYPVLPHQQ